LYKKKQVLKYVSVEMGVRKRSYGVIYAFFTLVLSRLSIRVSLGLYYD